MLKCDLENEINVTIKFTNYAMCDHIENDVNDIIINWNL